MLIISGQELLLNLQEVSQNASSVLQTAPESVSTEVVKSPLTNEMGNLEIFVGLMQQQNEHIANQIMLLQQSHNDLQFFITMALTLITGAITVLLSVGGFFLTRWYAQRQKDELKKTSSDSIYRWMLAKQMDEGNFGGEQWANIMNRNNIAHKKQQHQIDEIPADKIKSPQKDKK